MMSEEKNILVTHYAENTKYVLTVDGQEAGAAHYVNVADGVRDFNHTVVDDAFRGQGLSKPLISSALDQSREDGVKRSEERRVGKECGSERWRARYRRRVRERE